MNWVPGGPSLDRSVMTDELLLARAASSLAFWLALPEPAPKKPPPAPPPARPPPKPPGAVVVVVVEVDDDVLATPTVRSTTMSVPTLDRGDSTLFCAFESPLDTPTMPMTRPTPAASPRAVTSVRLQRRHSSCRTYRIETTDRAHFRTGALRGSHLLQHLALLFL